MKFLCPSCKAKYQIADEKVAGRNVKMKCRKCGHLIHVNQAAAAPQSVLPAAPTPTAERDARASVPRGNVTPRAPEGRAPSSPRAAAPSSPRATAPSSPRATAPLGTAARAPAPRGSAPRAAAPPRATVPRAPLGASPRPSSPVGPAGRGAALGAAGSLGAAVAQSPAPTGASLRAVAEPEVPESVQADSAVDSGGDRASGVGSSPSSAPASGAAPASAGYGSYTEDEDEATVVASVGLAAALTRAMDEDPAPSSVLATDGEAEWYVGVAGAPEGPLTVPQLKERIAAGSVELETLVWKDGFDDWRPLSQFPELAAVVEEFRPSKPMGLGAPTPSPGPAAFNDAEDDLGFGALGFGQPRIGPNAPARPSQPEPSPVPPAPITGSEGIVTETRPSEIPLGLPKKHHNPAWQWLAVVAALGLGVTIGVVVWGGNKPKPVVKYVEVPVGPSAGATEAPAPATEPEKLENTEVPGDAKGEPGGGTKVAAKTGSGSPPTSTAASKGGGLDFGSGPKGPSGPSGTTGSGSGSSGASSQLDSSQVQRVVSSHTGSVKRSCWQPALSTRDKDAPSSARVSVTIKVAPSGSVSSVGTSGDPKGYRGLAGCIASRVRGWQFPAAGGPTTVNVPFVFAAQ